MADTDKKKPAGEKRKHNEGSSLSELDSTNTSFENKGKKQSSIKRRWRKLEQCETQNSQEIPDIQRRLKQMNDKLSNVMTKNDGSLR